MKLVKIVTAGDSIYAQITQKEVLKKLNDIFDNEENDDKTFLITVEEVKELTEDKI